MISIDQLIEIGTVQKLHGLNGELTASIIDHVFDELDNCPYLVLDMECIFVPFFIKSFRFRTDKTILISFDGIDTPEKADLLCGQKLYFDRRCFTPEEAEEYDADNEEDESYVGYTIIDSHFGRLGKIIAIDDQTINVLFIVEHQGRELMIPAADDFVEDIDDEECTITMNLPQGLINLDEAESEEA